MKFTVYSKKHGPKEVLVDDEDWDRVKDYKWMLALEQSSFYIVTGQPKRKDRVRFHRLITNAVEGQIVDHINRNTLDNRKSNLRFVTAKENAQNRSKQKGTSSRYRGVTWCKRNKKWLAAIRSIIGKRKHLGYFNIEEDAARAYDKAVDFYGSLAPKNNV